MNLIDVIMSRMMGSDPGEVKVQAESAYRMFNAYKDAGFTDEQIAALFGEVAKAIVVALLD